MSASTAVFGTYELLEGILKHLPARDLTTATKVALTWQGVVFRSATLRARRALVPYDRTEPSKYKANRTTEAPLYDAASAVRYRHPKTISASRHRKELHQGRTYYTHLIQVGPEGTTIKHQYEGIQDEYATEPPVQALMLRLVYHDSFCMVYDKEGVRFRHVVDAAKGMMEIVDRFQNQPRLWDGVFVHFETVTIPEDGGDSEPTKVENTERAVIRYCLWN